MGNNDSTTNNSEAEQRTPPLRGKTLLLSAAIVLSGAALLWVIFNTEPTTEREDAVRQTAMPVDVITPETGTFRPTIEALGQVRPVQALELRPQVGGLIIELSPQLEPGNFVRAGDVLLRIEDADYRNLLLQRESELLQAQAELDIERGRQVQAEREYRELKRDRGEALSRDNLSLVLREPQLRSAEARVRAAQAAEAQARLNLERTVIRAPFDAQVLARSANLGSQVANGEPLAELAGIDRYWVEASVPLDMLRWLVFASDDGSEGSLVRVRHRTAWGPDQFREGRLQKLVGELEGETRLARVLVAVDDPLARRPEHAEQPSLIIGAFVEAQIAGREIVGALKLPRALLRQNDTVWLMREGALAVQPVSVVFQDADAVYVDSGLKPGDQVVTTNLATVRDGIRLRLRSAGGGMDRQVVAEP
ncbi:MAG: efflux RND transporter periplasmic adaptor subunit [Xanthomonadales bacterium]|nr:efflux RND transporter periplasmic adaptor subunit [Xanthomonadales bacterium]